MSSSRLYLGPFNDPGGISGSKYWEQPHDTACCNPAFRVRRNGANYVATVAVRNRHTEASPSDVSVSFYVTRYATSVTSSTIDAFVNKLISGVFVNSVVGIWQFTVNSGGIEPYCEAHDRPWLAGPATFGLATARGVVVVATLTCPSWNVGPTPGVPPSKDPCIGVWIGP